MNTKFSFLCFDLLFFKVNWADEETVVQERTTRKVKDFEIRISDQCRGTLSEVNLQKQLASILFVATIFSVQRKHVFYFCFLWVKAHFYF